jgi:hypothetical protein
MNSVKLEETTVNRGITWTVRTWAFTFNRFGLWAPKQGCSFRYGAKNVLQFAG